MTTGVSSWPTGRRPPRPAPSPPPATVALLPPALARLVAFAALGLFCLEHWMALVAPSAGDRGVVVLVVALAAALALLRLDARPAGRRRTAGAAGTVLAAALVALAAAGLPLALLEPSRWGELTSNIADGLDGLGHAAVPYQGVNAWARLDILLGGAALTVLAAALAFWPGGPTSRRRGAALVALGVLYGVPAVQIAFQAQFLRGAVFGLLVCGFLWLERLPKKDTRAAAAVTGGALLLAMAIGPVLDRNGPWIDYENWDLSLSGARAETFDWNHRYGPLDWPRDGRVLLHVRARQSSYWKAENLDEFDGLRWRHSDLAAGATVATAPRRREWVQTVRVVLGDLRSSQFIGAGDTLRIKRPPREAFRGGSPGTWEVAGSLRRGDAYDAVVYTPRPSPAQLAAAGTRYEPALAGELTVSIPPPLKDRPAASDADYPHGGDVTFPTFGSHAAAMVGTRNGIPLPAGASAIRGSVYGGAYALARRLAAASATPNEFVRRVQAYLSRGFVYDENVPERTVPLEDFLFRDKRGYCQQFSGAMALLLRMGGVPARVATGFTPGSFDKRTGQYTVRDYDAHSWVEVWFPGYGWVLFDPTPAVAPPRSQVGGDRAAAGGAGVPIDRGRGDQLGIFASREGGGGGPPWSLIAVGAAALAAAGVGGVATLRRRRRLRPAMTWDAELAELERALWRTGRPPEPATTLAALERRFRDTGAAGYVRALTRLRFAGDGPGPTHADRRALRHALAEGLGPTGRLRAWWALPPRRPAWTRR